VRCTLITAVVQTESVLEKTSIRTHNYTS